MQPSLLVLNIPVLYFLVLHLLVLGPEFQITIIARVLVGAFVPPEVDCELLGTVTVLRTVGAVENETPRKSETINFFDALPLIDQHNFKMNSFT